MDKLIELFVSKGYSKEAKQFLKSHGTDVITNIEESLYASELLGQLTGIQDNY